MVVIPCEICKLTNGGLNKFIANHTICEQCFKKLKVPKEETIKKQELEGLELEKKINLKFKSYRDTILECKMKHWKRIIYYDIILERYKKIEKKNES